MSPHNPDRRNLLKSSGIAALAAAAASSGLAACAQTTAKSSAVSDGPNTGRCTPARNPRRMLGKLEVTALGLGCQGFGQNMYGVPQPAKADAMRVIRQAYDYGVTFFDTAEAYGPFESERLVGEAVQPFRNHIVIATKFGWDIDQTTGQRTGKLNSRPEHIRRVVDAMLGRLKTDRIDLLYQHRVDPDVPIEDVAGVVQDLMKQGKVLNWGLSEPGVQTVRRAHAVQPLTAIQNEYNLFHRGVEKDILPLCQELGIGLVPWSPLAMGTLAGYVDENSRFSAEPGMDLRAAIPRYQPAALRSNVRVIRLLQTWAKRHTCTPAQFALAWLQAQAPFVVPIPGTTKTRHLLDNLGADDVKLNANEWAQFRRELEKIQVQGFRLPEAVLKFSGVEARRK